jgi:hypothetical protein
MHHAPPRGHSAAISLESAPQSLCLVGVPVETFLQAQQHTDDLVRELWLVSESGHQPELRDLERAADAYARRTVAVRDASLDAVTGAFARKEPTVDVRLSVPAGTAALTVQWTELLERLDELCRAGTLLTLPATAEIRRFRRWYADETVRQLRGGLPPRPYGADRAGMLVP